MVINDKEFLKSLVGNFVMFSSTVTLMQQIGLVTDIEFWTDVDDYCDIVFITNDLEEDVYVSLVDKPCAVKIEIIA